MPETQTQPAANPLACLASGIADAIADGFTALAGLATGRSELRWPVVRKSEAELVQKRRATAQAELTRLKEAQASLHRRIEQLTRQLRRFTVLHLSHQLLAPPPLRQPPRLKRRADPSPDRPACSFMANDPSRRPGRA